MITLSTVYTLNKIYFKLEVGSIQKLYRTLYDTLEKGPFENKKN